MNILMVGPHRKVRGGISTVVNNYYESDLVNKVKLYYLATTIDGNKLIKFVYAILAYLNLFRILCLKKIDIVHIHMASRNSFYRKSIIVKIAKIFRKKIILHMHGAEFNNFYYKESNEKQKVNITKILNSANYIIALSDEWEQNIRKYCKVPVYVLFNAIKVPEINYYDLNSKNITLLGRLDKRKGIFDVLEVIKEICNIHPEAKFVLAGDGDLVLVQELIKKKQLDKHVILLGWINKQMVNDVLKATAIYVLPSYNEGMPMSILEAMSYGIPIIASDVGGIPTIIDNEINGFLIEPGDKYELSNNILSLLNNIDMRKNFSKSAYSKAISTFDIEANTNRLLELYKIVILG
ncbi:glycosyltransferase family 4 protein [Clostridium akagii]|uniref:glycosyltransferase family 4 protein n=1 Tax=Clostridium akagii TaxID=91623 RepID=UPI00047C4899|nr:glycosyltransferase family 4 protein [Clostridium akagii]